MIKNFALRSGSAVAAFLVFFMGNAALAEDISLGRADIQALRLINTLLEPKIFEHLSPVGQERLFSDAAKDLEVISVSDAGVWQWRTPNDPRLQTRQGVKSDAAILLSVLAPGSESDEYADQNKEISRDAVAVLKLQGQIWTNVPGATIQFQNPHLVERLGRQIAAALKAVSASPEASKALREISGNVIKLVPESHRSNLTNSELDLKAIDSLREGSKSYEPSLAPTPRLDPSTFPSDRLDQPKVTPSLPGPRPNLPSAEQLRRVQEELSRGNGGGIKGKP